MKLPAICLLVLFLLTGQPGYSQNLTLIDSLEMKVQLADNDSVRTQVYFGLTWHGLLHDLKRSSYYTNKVLVLTRNVGDSLGIYKAYHYWGLIHQLEGNYDASPYYFQNAVSFHLRQGHKGEMLKIYQTTHSLLDEACHSGYEQQY